MAFLKKASVLLNRGITLLFDKSYDQYVEEDSKISDMTYEYSYVLSKMVNSKPGNVLDIGPVSALCIPAMTLCELGFKVFGVDLRNFAFRHKNYAHTVCDILTDKLPFSNEFFDYAILVSTIEHVGLSTAYSGQKESEDGDIFALKEISRTLKPGAMVVMTFPFAGKEFRVNKNMRSYDNARIQKMIVESGLMLSELRIMEMQNNPDGNQFSEIPLDIAMNKQNESGANVTMLAFVQAFKR